MVQFSMRDEFNRGALSIRIILQDIAEEQAVEGFDDSEAWHRALVRTGVIGD